MPELPEVETVCQALKLTLEGASFQEIQLNREGLRYPFPVDFESRVIHQPICSIRRRAKYILIDFKHGLTLIWHLGMSGRVIVKNSDSPFEKLDPHDHVIFTTTHHQRIIYRDARRFGFMQLLSTSQVDSVVPFSTLGPEPLDDLSFTAVTFYNSLKRRRISLKSALLDQRIIAGIGNIYASEALWQAKLSPLRLTHTLTLREAEYLLGEIQDVLKRAIAAGGSTLKDHAHPNGNMGYFQHHFKAYNQKNKLCGHCQMTLLLKIMQNGRATYYCQTCQQ